MCVFLRSCVCVYVHVCMYVCGWICVCECLCAFVCVPLCVFLRSYVRVCVCVCVCEHVRICVDALPCVCFFRVYVRAYDGVYMSVCEGACFFFSFVTV